MKHIWPFIFILFIGLSNTFLFAQSEDEFFHKAGFEYYRADYPKAHKIVVNGLEKYNSSEKLTKLKELICEQWPGCEGTSPPLTPPCNGNDRDGDGICDRDDVCPDDPDNTCNEDYTEPGCMDSNAINYDPYATEDCCCEYDHSPQPLPVRGCMDPSANNYDSYATENCCCEYLEKLKINLSHVQNTRKVTWHNDLRRASYLKLTLFKEINDEIVRERVVTGASSHTFRLPGSLANKKLRIELTVLYDENKYDISTSEVKVLRNQFFPCGDDE